MGSELTVKSENFEHSLARILATTKREAPIVLREQGRGVIRWVQLYTAPGHEGVTGQEAKRHGEAKVEADIRKLMIGVSGNRAGLSQNIARIHKSGRNPRTGRVNRSLGASKFRVPATELAKYIASKKKMVGFLASGWNAAAAKLGAKAPAWIWRHNGDGDVRDVTTSDSVKIVATNKVGFASRAINQLQRVLDFAYRAQKGANDRRWKTFIEGQARKALRS